MLASSSQLLLTYPGPDPVPWYYPLEGDILKSQTLWDSEHDFTSPMLSSLTEPPSGDRLPVYQAWQDDHAE